MLLKLRDIPSFTFPAFPAIERLLSLTYEHEGSPLPGNPRSQPPLPCEGDVSYTLLANNLETLTNLVEVTNFL